MLSHFEWDGGVQYIVEFLLPFSMIKAEKKDDDEEKPEKVNNGHKKNFITSTFLSSVV